MMSKRDGLDFENTSGLDIQAALHITTAEFISIYSVIKSHPNVKLFFYKILLVFVLYVLKNELRACFDSS